MGFVMQGLDKSDYDREYGDWTLLRRIMGYFKPYTFSMLIIAITISAASIAAALVPVYISQTLDSLRDGVDFDEVYLLLAIIAAFTLLNFIINAVRQILTARTVQSAVVDLREEAFDALLDRDMAFFDNQPTGRLASRVVNDSNSFGQVISLTVNLLGQIG